MPAGLHLWPSQNTATKLYLMQAGGIAENLRRGTHAAPSCTGQLKADFRYVHFPDNVPLNLWKMKKDSNKMYELKNCLPSKQPWTISAPNKMEAGAWLCARCWAEPASPHQRSQQSQLCSSLGWILGTQKAPKSQPHTSYPQSYMSLFFPQPLCLSPFPFWFSAQLSSALTASP